MNPCKSKPGQRIARNLNAQGRRIFFAKPRSRIGGGGVNRDMREFMAVIAERLGRG